MSTFAHQIKRKKINRDIEAFLEKGGQIRQIPRGVSGDKTSPSYGYLTRTQEEIEKSRKRGSAAMKAHNRINGHPRKKQGGVK